MTDFTANELVQICLNDNTAEIDAKYGQTCLLQVNSIKNYSAFMNCNYSDLIQTNVKYNNSKCID